MKKLCTFSCLWLLPTPISIRTNLSYYKSLVFRMSEYYSRISGLGAYLPQQIVTNDDLAKKIDTSDEWIVSRTGIKQRHIIAPEESTSDLAANAAIQALADAHLNADELDMILLATLTPDMMMPSTACQVQGKIGASNAAAVDLGAACSGFLYGLSIADQFIHSGSMKHILVIGTETMSRFLDWSDRTCCVLFGDGAGAAILSRSETKSIHHFHLGANGQPPKEWLMLVGSGSVRPLLTVGTAGLDYITMNGKAIFRFGSDILIDIIRKSLESTNQSIDDIDLIIPHQANRRIVEYACDKAKIPFEKFYLNIDRRANTSSATIPIAMVDAIGDGKLHRGDSIILASFGAGLTWGGMVLDF